MSKDKAARIAARARETVNDGEPVWSRETIAKDIRRAIAYAVRKERERCVKCVQDAANCKIIATSGLAAMRVMEQVAIEAIVNEAKRPSRRK